MDINQFRQQYGGLPNLTDREIVEYVAKARGFTPDNMPDYEGVIQRSMGQDRTWGETVGDTALGVAQGVVGLGQGLATLGSAVIPGVSAFGNPVAQGLDQFGDWIGGYQSEGMQARQADAQRRVDIAERQATNQGEGFWGRVGSGLQARAGAYWDDPSLLGQDLATAAPSVLAPAGAARGVYAVARGLGLAGGTAASVATGGGVAAGMGLQGADIAQDTFERIAQEITGGRRELTPQEYERAAAQAAQAGVQAAAVTGGVAMLPFGRVIERSLIPGAGTGTAATTMTGALARRGAAGTVEGFGEGAEGGTGQYFGNVGVSQFNPNQDLAQGVGSAAVQEGVAGTGLGAALYRPRPRTETGEIPLTETPEPNTPPAVPKFEAQFDANGEPILDYDSLPVGDYPIGRGYMVSKSANGDVVVWPDQQPTATAPVQEGRRDVGPPEVERPPAMRRGLNMDDFAHQGPSYVDLVTQPQQEPANFVDLANRNDAPLPEDPYTQWDRQAGRPSAEPTPERPRQGPTAQGEIPIAVTGEGVAFQAPNQETIDAVAAARQAQAQAQQTPEAGTQAQITRGDILREIAALKRSYTRNDGELRVNAPESVRSIIEAADPLAAIREAYQDGSGLQDEFLDNLHQRLTGQDVAGWKSTQVTPPINQAGFVTEPLEQVQAQAQAVREGRKDALIVPPEQAGQVDLAGLASARVEDRQVGEAAVIAARDPAVVQQAQARTQEVGMRQALGEAQGRVDPAGTSANRGGEVVVQQVDNQTGQVLDDEVVTPQNVPNVRPIPGTTPQVVPTDSVVQARQGDASVNTVNPSEITVAKRRRVNAGPLEGTHTELTFSDGSVARIQRMDSASTQGLPGWHDLDGDRTSYLGDTEAEATQEMLRRKQLAAAESTAAPETAPKKRAKKAPPVPTEQVIETAETVEGETEYADARYELFKRWFNDADEKAQAYLEDTKNRSNLTEQEKRDFEARLAAEVDAKQANKRARKFNSARARPAREVGTPLSLADTERIVADVASTVSAAANIQVVTSPIEVGLEFPAGMTVAGATLEDGSIVVFSNGNTSKIDVLRTIFHEMFHKGIARTNDYINDLNAWAKRDPWVQAQANQWKQTQDANRVRQGLGQGRPLTAAQLREFNAIAVDEAMARMASDLMADKKLGSKQRNKMVRALARWLSSAADSLGLKDLAQWARRQTYTEVEKFVADTLNRGNQSTDTPPPGRGTRARAIESPNDTPAARIINDTVKAQDVEVKGRGVSDLMLRGMSLRQITEQFEKVLPAIRNWTDTIFARGAAASKLARKADDVALMLERAVKNKQDRKDLADILLGASMAEISLDNTDAKYLASLDAEQRAEHTRLRTKLAALARRSPEAALARRQALDILQEQWQYTRDSLEKFITNTVKDPADRAQRIADLRQEFGRVRGDYFPFSRFGQKVVIGVGAAKDGRNTVEFFETDREANAAATRLQRAGFKYIINEQTAKDANARASTGFMGSLHNAVDSADMDANTKNELHQTLQQLYLRSLPELSGAKHMIRRESVEGYSMDVLRVFADAVTRGAHYASRLDHAGQMQAAQESAADQARSTDKREAAVVIGRKDGASPVVKVVPVGLPRLDAFNALAADGYVVETFNAIPEAVRERVAAQLPELTEAEQNRVVTDTEKVVGRNESRTGEDLRKAKAIYNYMIERNNRAFNRDDKFDGATDMVGQLGHTWFLVSPTYWLTNIMQNPMVGIPHLGAKYGITKSALAWGRTMRWFSGVRLSKAINDRTTPFSVAWLRDEVKAGRVKDVSEAELKMLQDLEDRQLLDFTQAMDLSRIGQASSGTWNKAMRTAAGGAHHTEVFNRVTFALAAYRLALQSGSTVTHEQAVQRTGDDLAATHFDYSGVNKAEFMKGNVSRMVFMFQQYRQHMLYWWFNNVKQAVKGESKEERARAIKAAIYMATAQGVFAGARGLPFIGAIGLIAELASAAIGGDDDEPFNFERYLSEGAKAALGEAGGETFTKGVLALAGMDIGQRIGQHDLAPFLNLGSARFERNPDDKARAYLFDMLGPLGSQALNFAKAGAAVMDGDAYKAVEYAAPKGAADIIKAYNMANQGVTNSRGQVILAAEKMDGVDIALQALGTRPTKVSKARNERGRIMDIEQHYVDRGRSLRSAFVQAWARQDNEGIKDALEGIQTYNTRLVKERPIMAREFAITAKGLTSALRDYQQRAMMLALTDGSAETRRQAMIALQMFGLMGAQDVEESSQLISFDN